MGRRPRVHGARIDEYTVEGSHDGFRPRGDHRRRIRWAPGRGASWVDVVDGPTEVPVTVRIGLGPRISARIDGSRIALEEPRGLRLTLTAPARGTLSLEQGVYCERFGNSEKRSVVCWRGTAGRGYELPFAIERTD
jgi:hypothetical protein